MFYSVDIINFNNTPAASESWTATNSGILVSMRFRSVTICYLIETKSKRSSNISSTDAGGWEVSQWYVFCGRFSRCTSPPGVPYKHLVQNQMNMLDFWRKIEGFLSCLVLRRLRVPFPASPSPVPSHASFLLSNSLPSTLDLCEHSDCSVCRGAQQSDF